MPQRVRGIVLGSVDVEGMGAAESESESSSDSSILAFHIKTAPSRLTVYIYQGARVNFANEVDSVINRTVFPSAEKYAPSTASLCPANVFGRKPSTGFKVNSRAVISREVVMKHLSKVNLRSKTQIMILTASQGTTGCSILHHDDPYTFGGD